MFKKENSASRHFLISATLWVVVGVLMGLTLALQFVFPDLFRGIPVLVFSRFTTGTYQYRPFRLSLWRDDGALALHRSPVDRAKTVE